MPDLLGDPPRIRTVGEKIQERSRERRAAAEKSARSRRRDPSHPAASPPTLREGAGLLGRIAIFAVFTLLAYVVLRQMTYIVFAPELEVLRTIVPDGLTAGEPFTMGVVVRNHGPLSGASFVVAVSGDVETEGPTLDVPPRDTALIPVRLTLNSGRNAVSLVVFDGWRGVRQLRAYRNLPVGVQPRFFEIQVTEQASRGDLVAISVPWSNPGMAAETVIPVVVLRPEGGGAPLDQEGPEFQLLPGEARTLEFTLDTWPLRAGRYSLEVFLEAPGRERVAQGSSPHFLEVTEP